MPSIIVKDYTWRQTEQDIIIQVNFRNVPKKVDLLAIGNYTKASYPPFILELFLWSNIIEEKSQCVLSENKIIISLKKEISKEEWPQLVLEDLSKDEKGKYRLQALERARKRSQERRKARDEKREFLQKEAVRAQIDLDTNTLNKIQEFRDAHRREAMEEFEDWRNRAELPPFLPGIEGEVQENRKAFRPALKWFKDKQVDLKNEEGREQREKTLDDNNKTAQSNLNRVWRGKSGRIEMSETVPNTREEIDETRKGEASSASEDYTADFEIPARRGPDKTKRSGLGSGAIERASTGKGNIWNRRIFNEPDRAIPLPRKSGVIKVTFTERVFPTPARESHHLEEQEWLEKQADARRKSGFVAEDLRPEEQNPQWLKDKGDDFFKAGNHLGAISAYTHGIKLSDKMSSLYMNRSAAHYAHGNYHRCVEDCTKALELMVPECEGNKQSRAKCHARRGAALCKLSAPQHGIPELELAIRLTPDDESIKGDLRTAKQYFQMPA